MHHRPDVMDLAETRRRILVALRHGGDARADAGAWAEVDAARLRRLPPWVERFGALADGDGYMLLVTRREAADWRDGPASPPGESTAIDGGQFVMDIEPGRYFVDTLDLDTSRVISRESASGHPLVAGLVCPGSAVLVRIRRVSE